MNKKVLVTGGAGFIGSTLIRELLKDGYKVDILDNFSTGLFENLPSNNKLQTITGDIRDFELVSTAVKGHSHLIHLAAQPFIPLSYQLPLQVVNVNTMGSINIFKACLDHDVKRLVHISSSEVYGSAQYTPMDEQHPLQPFSTYSVAKAAADMWAQTLHWEHKLPVVILRPFNTFGPYDTQPRFISEMIRQCFKEPKIHVGNLEASRDLTYVQDTVEAMIMALEAEGLEGDVINIGTCKTWKMRDILELIKKQTKTEEKEVVTDTSRLRPKDVMTLLTDNSKAKKVLGWAPCTPFEEGVRKTISWYLNNGKMWGYEIRGWRWRY